MEQAHRAAEEQANNTNQARDEEMPELDTRNGSFFSFDGAPPQPVANQAVVIPPPLVQQHGMDVIQPGRFNAVQLHQLYDQQYMVYKAGLDKDWQTFAARVDKEYREYMAQNPNDHSAIAVKNEMLEQKGQEFNNKLAEFKAERQKSIDLARGQNQLAQHVVTPTQEFQRRGKEAAVDIKQNVDNYIANGVQQHAQELGNLLLGFETNGVPNSITHRQLKKLKKRKEVGIANEINAVEEELKRLIARYAALKLEKAATGVAVQQAEQILGKKDDSLIQAIMTRKNAMRAIGGIRKERNRFLRQLEEPE